MGEVIAEIMASTTRKEHKHHSNNDGNSDPEGGIATMISDDDMEK